MDIADQMTSAAAALLETLDDQQRQLAQYAFNDDKARRWLEYRPNQRPGACIAGLSLPARKAAHRLLSTALSEHAFAQAMGIIALEEVLDRQEGGQNGRHSGDYWISVFGEPATGATAQPWGWRFEGHHVSVSMTLNGDQVSPAPVFFGADPACVSYAGRPVSRPLAPEEDLAQALLDAMEPAARADAVVASDAPADIHSATRPRSMARIEPQGIPASRLGPSAHAALGQLIALYLDRLRPELARGEHSRIAAGELYFAWEGPPTSEGRHYYRIQGDDLLIEYDTIDEGNHAHTVLRRPHGDFGGDVLAAHLRYEHNPADSHAAD
jgi:hypothetical protein